jgi:hypothetical protein
MILIGITGHVMMEIGQIVTKKYVVFEMLKYTEALREIQQGLLLAALLARMLVHRRAIVEIRR